MESNDLTLEILKSIRDEIRQTNSRLERLERGQQGTNERLDRLEHGLLETKERLDRSERRQLEGEVRLATEIVALAQAVRDVKQLLSDRLDVYERVQTLDKRVTVLEARAGI